MIEPIVIKCPQCGRNMPSYRDICFTCSGVELREADDIVQEARDAVAEKNKKLGRSTDRVSPERVKEIAASLEHLRDVLPGDSWHLGASLKHHDTRIPEGLKEEFEYFESMSKIQARSHGLSAEDVLKWDSVEDTGKYHGWHNDVINKECASYNRAFAQSLEGEDTWFRLQRLIEEGKLSIQDEYSIQLALKRSTALVGYTVEDGEVSIITSTLAHTNDEACGKTNGADHARRIKVVYDEEELRQVNIDISRSLLIRELSSIARFIMPEPNYFNITDLQLIRRSIRLFSTNDKPEVVVELSEVKTPDEAQAIREAHSIPMPLLPALVDEEESLPAVNITKIEFVDEYIDDIEECSVRVSHIGTNPMNDLPVRTPSRAINRDIVKVNGRIIEDALEPLREFYSQFDMHKHNYQGTVNKKSDGRCPRTGCYPDPKSPDMMQLYRHQPAIIIQPNVKIQETEHTVKYAQGMGLQQEREISKVTRGNDCECGCNVKVKDMRRGEVICPKCGLVFHRDTIVG